MANVEKVVLKYVKSNADIKPEVFDIAMGTDLEEDKVELALQSLLKQGLVVEKTNERGKSSWLPGSGKPAAPPPPPPAPIASPVADGFASEAAESRPAPAKPARAARVESDEDGEESSGGSKPWIWAVGSTLVSTMLAVGIAMTMIGGQYVPKSELETIKAREEAMKTDLTQRFYKAEKRIKALEEEKEKAAKAAEEAAKAKPAAKPAKKKGRR